MQLYIGNKNYSSWSLRAWLLLAKSKLTFSETQLVLGTPSFYKTLENITPTLKVPTLVDGDITVWDSLAICEYINDTYLSGKAWPQNAQQKAEARAIVCEMHSGFNAIRNEMPMNIRAKRRIELTEQAQIDIKRVEAIWDQQHTRYATQGGWLFGQWSIADAMFAPVVLRFETYGIKLNDNATCYMQHTLACPVLQKWISDSSLEKNIIQINEAGEDILG